MSEAFCGSARRIRTLASDGFKANLSPRESLFHNWTAISIHLRYSNHTTCYGAKIQHVGIEPSGTEFRSACISLAVRADPHRDSRQTAAAGSPSSRHSRSRRNVLAFANHDHHGL